MNYLRVVLLEVVLRLALFVYTLLRDYSDYYFVAIAWRIRRTPSEL